MIVLSTSKCIKIRLRDLLKLKRYADRHDLNDKEALGVAIDNLEVKKVESKEKNVWTCDDCKEKIPEDASFCPYCGVEFEEEAEDEDESEEED